LFAVVNSTERRRISCVRHGFFAPLRMTPGEVAMNNALFMTGVAVFFHIWGGAMLGTAIAKATAQQFDHQVLASIIGGALMAFTPLWVMGPTWVTLINRRSLLSKC
jgi:hypothetical protein